MKLFSATLFFSFLVSVATAQTTGWHIVQPGARYAVVSMAAIDVQRKAKIQSINLGVNECVLVSMQRGGSVFAFDPLGRLVKFTPGSLKPVANNSTATVGWVNENIDLFDGQVLNKGMFVWVEGQETGEEALLLRVAMDKTVKVPRRRITIIANDWENAGANTLTAN